MKPKISNSKSQLTVSTIQKLERNLKILLPEEYRNFLLEHNGGKPKPNVFPLPENPIDSNAIVDWFFSITEDNIYSLEWYYKTMKNRIPSELLPIATDPGGNLICIQVSGSNIGRLYFWDHEQEPFTNPDDYSTLLMLANNFDEFIDSFTELPK
jgi:cell wall assembly regulator SMI1